MNFFSKIYEIPRVAAVRAWYASSVLVNSTVHSNKRPYPDAWKFMDTKFSRTHTCIYMPKRGYILIFFTSENGTKFTDPAQTQLSSVSSTLKSPIFPDLACGLGSAAWDRQPDWEILVDLDSVKYPALDSYYFVWVRGAAFFCTTHRGKLLQHKLIRVKCTKKSARVPVSPVPQYGYWT